MESEILGYVQQYGYLAVFVLVFLQEIGIPNPIPNELVLIFSGYLAFAGKLDFVLVFLVAVLGDFIGTTLLYFVFRYFGKAILKNKPRWIPISEEKIKQLSRMVSKKGGVGIFLGRLVPYIRGYISVAAGLIQVPPKIFLPTVLISACIWSGGYVTLGKLLGSQWHSIIGYLGGIQNFVLIIIVLIAMFYIVKIINKKRQENVDK